MHSLTQRPRADVAEKENVNPSTVSHIYGRYGKMQKFYEKKHQSGCPHKLNDYDMHIALQKLSNGSAQNVTDLQQKEFLNVSVDMLRRELRRLECAYMLQEASADTNTQEEMKGVGISPWIMAEGELVGCLVFRMSQSSIFLGWMGGSGAGGGLGRHLETATPRRQ